MIKTKATETRTFLHDGKRIHVHLEPAVWRVIDWQAADMGWPWGQMVSYWLTSAEMAGEADTNTTRVIRTTALQKLADETIFADRQATYQDADAIWRTLGMVDDSGLRDAVRAAHVTGQEDFVGFQIKAGIGDNGCVTFYIENGIKDCLNLIISTPFSMSEWEGAMGKRL